MSDNLLRLVPKDPDILPSPDARRKAQELFTFFVPDADAVRAIVTEDVQFIDCGSNLERVLCPICQADLLPDDEWGTLMDAAYQTHFTSLSLPMPCCGAVLSLNELGYDWPAGFGRFVLEARNPCIAAFDPAMLSRIESILGCRLRVIWAHQ